MHAQGMDEFQAIIVSLGEHLVQSVGKENLESLTVVGEPSLFTADVHIGLDDGSWAAEERAIDKVLEVIGLFDDEGLHVSYCFVPDALERIEQQAAAKVALFVA